MQVSASASVNVTTDVVCALFMLMVLVYLRTNSDKKERMSWLFAWICVLNIGMLMGDIPNWICEGYATPWNPLALRVGTFLLYLCGSLIPWVYSLYIHAYLSRKSRVERWFLPTVHGIFGVTMLMLLVNSFNGMFYFISAENTYMRGNLFWLSQLVPVIILLLDVWVVVHNRHAVRTCDITAFITYLTLPIIAIVVQTVFYGVSVTYSASAISTFIIFLIIQSEQRLLSEQQKNDLEKAQLTITLSQIQPHFLYNSLQVIKYLCDTEPAKASEALDHFSFYLRGNLDGLTDNRLVTFEKELAHIEDFLYLEKMRFAEKLNIEFELLCTDFMLPPLTVQPIIDNAIRHGLNKKKGGGTVHIKTEREGNTVVVTVTDDGVGFDSAEPKDDSRSHVGLDNTRRRLHLLCGAWLEIKSTKGAGTTVRMFFPQSAEPE